MANLDCLLQYVQLLKACLVPDQPVLDWALLLLSATYLQCNNGSESETERWWSSTDQEAENNLQL